MSKCYLVVTGTILSALSIRKGIVDFHIFRGCEELHKSAALSGTDVLTCGVTLCGFWPAGTDVPPRPLPNPTTRLCLLE
ncbi:hypothetical protein EX191_02320 [Vibrio chemaguriensis]|uniref:Secreted protein n=1 Tax=Vibrio chemaguriensis TaxID=2527672 RepID=A0ABX1HS61_9VIBR|nr:hypothetical protein [Vibrio chemaguriensis]